MYLAFLTSAVIPIISCAKLSCLRKRPIIHMLAPYTFFMNMTWYLFDVTYIKSFVTSHFDYSICCFSSRVHVSHPYKATLHTCFHKIFPNFYVSAAG